jgi:hypothetical protein
MSKENRQELVNLFGDKVNLAPNKPIKVKHVYRRCIWCRKKMTLVQYRQNTLCSEVCEKQLALQRELF